MIGHRQGTQGEIEKGTGHVIGRHRGMEGLIEGEDRKAYLDMFVSVIMAFNRWIIINVSNKEVIYVDI